MIIGITGGIGSGKSTIVQELAKRGFAVYDCDREAKRIIAENEDVQAAIIDLLGEEAFIKSQIKNQKSRIYNTPYVAKRVFENPQLLDALNRIVHPAVKEDICQRSGLSAKRSVLCQPKAVLFIESAILFEANLDDLCDKIILVDAPEDIRIARTIARDYQGEASEDNINKVRARMKSQPSVTGDRLPDKKTTVLMNDGTYSISALADQIIALL
ncbi:MAG: dephospho-CoA kinase [Paludibacteraceae bacterium]|nr:dephospho-CoA kinase [Paludibacteraceae bacterium]